jgi:hypothetical protein
MKTITTFKKSFSVVIIGFVLLTSCNALKTALYDQHSYEQAISLKVEALDLMKDAVNPFADYKTEVNDFLKEFEKLTEYEKNKPNNELSYKMLELIGNKDKNLLGGFLKRWEDKSKLSSVFIELAQEQVKDAFEILIKYEGKKDKEEITSFISNN